MRLLTKTILIIALSLFSISEALAYEPQSCSTSPCDVQAADYVEITQPTQSGVVSWSVLDNTQLQLGMTLNPKSGVFTWTPTNQQTGNFTIDIAGLDATDNSIIAVQIQVNVQANEQVDWENLLFVTPVEFAPNAARDMDGSLDAPYSQDKLGSEYCKDDNNDPVTTSATVYFRGGLHTTEIGDNPAAIFCNGESLEAPFVLTAWGNERPIISPKGTEAFKIQGDFVTIDGFEIAGYIDQISLADAVADWWSEDRPSSPEGYIITAQGILAKGQGIVIKNNLVHSWPGNAVKIEGDLSSMFDNVVFDSGYYSTRGVGGVMVEGLNDSDINMPSDREYGILVKNNVIYGNESRIISHVFSKEFSTLEIDEGSAMNLQQNGGDYTRGYLVENNAFLYNGKGVGLRAKNIVFRNNTVYGNGLNLRAPGASGIRATKITTGSLASVFDGDAGSIATVTNNIIAVPSNQEAISIDSVSRISGGCSSNIVQGIIDDSNEDCALANNSFINNDPVIDSASNNFQSLSGDAGAEQSLISNTIAKLNSYGYELKPSGFDIMSIHDYDEYVLPMINEILLTTPPGDSGVELIFEDENGGTVSTVNLDDDDYEDLLDVATIKFNWQGTRPKYDSSNRFVASYKQYIKAAPDVYFDIVATVSPVASGYVKCSDSSIRSTKNQRDTSCEAIPFAGYTFSNWSGACSGATCDIDSVDSDITVNAVFTAIVTDQTAPVLNVPGNITVAASSVSGASATTSAIVAFLADAGATDNVDGDVSVSNNAPATFPIGTTTVTFSASDAAGNTVTGTATVTVADSSAPSLSAPSNITVAASDANGTANTQSAIAAFLSGASASDDVTSELSISNDAPAVFPLGVTTVTFSVTDGNANTTTATATVTVTDQTAPVIQEVTNQTVIGLSNGLAKSDPQILAILNEIVVSDNLDEDLVVTNNVPTQLLLGDNTITVTATDGAGNTAQETFVITVTLDTNAPVLVVPDDIGVDVLNPDDRILSSDTFVQAFLSKASATDDIDGELSDVITNNIPDSLAIGEYTITFSVTDSAGNTASDTVKITVMIRDNDEDGLPDYFEIAQGLDPNDPSDALIDSDGDGVSNLEEFIQGSDINLDDQQPILTLPPNIDVIATGKFTGVDLGIATAIDAKDGELLATPNQMGPFESGLHEVVWSATDSAGNTSTAIQYVAVTPLVSLLPDTFASEGSRLTVDVLLSGEAVNYPVDMELVVSGNATEADYAISATQLSIEEGRLATVELSVFADEVVDSGEEITLRLTSVSNAKIGAKDTQKFTIVEENVAPFVEVLISQNDENTLMVSQSNGAINLTVNIEDVNEDDLHSITFDETTTALINETEINHIFTMDITTLPIGVYSGEAIVSDDAQNELSTKALFYFEVVSSLPELSNIEDSDNDGISDAEEGVGDDDNDGIPNYKDNLGDGNIAPISQDSNRIVEADAGIVIVLGETAFSAGNNAIGITEEQVITVTGVADDDYEYPTGLIDFVMKGAKPGETYRLVIPLESAIPANAVFRKFSLSFGWSDFVEDANNGIKSAQAVNNTCPSIGSSLFTAGLTEGHNCLELLIKDGGPNDTDGLIDGKVTDPSGIAVRAFGPPSNVNSVASFSADTLRANENSTAVLTVTAQDDSSRLLEGLTLSATSSLGAISVFTEVGNGVYRADYTAGNQKGIDRVSVTLSNGTEQTFISAQIELTKKSSGGSTHLYVLYGLLLMLLISRKLSR